jgi:hypothetical protein
VCNVRLSLTNAVLPPPSSLGALARKQTCGLARILAEVQSSRRRAFHSSQAQYARLSTRGVGTATPKAWRRRLKTAHRKPRMRPSGGAVRRLAAQQAAPCNS